MSGVKIEVRNLRLRIGASPVRADVADSDPGEDGVIGRSMEAIESTSLKQDISTDEIFQCQ